MIAHFAAGLSVLVALLLTLAVSQLDWLAWWPRLTELTVIYWVLAVPHRFNLPFAIGTGLLLDAISGDLIGQNVAILVVCTALVLTLYERLRMNTRVEQSVFVGALMTAAIGFDYSLAVLAGHIDPARVSLLGQLWAALTSALAWPPLFLLLRRLRRRLRIA